MALTSITEQRNQANREATCAQARVRGCMALALYASVGHDVIARALETVKPLLPNETIAAVDAILDAQAMAGSEYVVSVREREVA